MQLTRGRARARYRSLIIVVPFAVVAMAVAAAVAPRAPADVQVHLTAAGDYGAKAATATVLQQVAARHPDAHLALGDLAYGDLTPETAWCTFVKNRVGEGFPFELISGNHESSDANDGKINNYGACLPNQIPGIVGTYGREYYMDFPRVDPLVRVIQTSAGLTFEDGKWAYSAGDTHSTWLVDAIDGGRAAGAKWIIVTSHYPCLSMTAKICSTAAFTQLMLSKKVDLVLHGHAHVYERTHQLATGTGACPSLAIGTFNAGCVADTDGDFTGGRGTVFATVGTGGAETDDVNSADTEAGYFGTASARNLNPSNGLLDLSIDDTHLSANYVVTSGGPFTDSFTITDGPPPTIETIVDDPFTRTLASGWGSAPVGGAWTVSPAAAFSVNGTEGRITTPAAGGRTAFLRTVTSTSADATATVGIDKLPIGAGSFVGVVGRSVTGAGDYRAFVGIKPDGRVTLAIRRTAGDGTVTSLVPEAVIGGLTYGVGDRLQIRLQVIGTNPTTVQAKVWKVGASEPVAWAQSKTDSTAGLQTAGAPGLTASAAAGVTNAPIVTSFDGLLVTSP
jgi:hypothetical protein